LPVPDPPIDADDVVALATSFRERFEDSYGIALDLPTQIHNLRVHVVRVVEKFAPRAGALTDGNASAARIGERAVVFPSSGTAAIVTALYDRTKLAPGDFFEGPAVIAAPESTIVVPPHTRAEVDAYGTVLLTL
jgi:N-methylhydantoinase A